LSPLHGCNIAEASRLEGKDGLAVVSIHIDSKGRVRDVELLEGSHPALNAVVLRKIKNAIFSPAYDE
jgi:TonB family C-terminal domain